MAEIIPVERKSPVLNHPALPCLHGWHTINLLAGCPYACRYCYAKSFRSNPGGNRVLFYENTLERLEQEFSRKRIKPKVVYLSTACDPFPPDRRILDCQFGVVEFLLERGVHLLVSTKSFIPIRFIRLFDAYPNQAVIQMGLTTLDDGVRRIMEPHAASVNDRLKTLETLSKHRIGVEARLDPLIPELTDTEESLDALFQRLKECGVATASASHLFLRRSVTIGMNQTIGEWSFRSMAERIYTKTIERYCGNNSIRIPAESYRKEKHELLKSISSSHGILLRLCRCKNPDLTEECCHPQFPQNESSQMLFTR